MKNNIMFMKSRAFMLCQCNVLLFLLVLLPCLSAAADNETVFLNHLSAAQDTDAEKNKKLDMGNSRSSKQECLQMRTQRLAGMEKNGRDTATIQDQHSASSASNRSDSSPIRSSLLPIWGDEARKRGYEIPRAFGISPGYFYGRRDVKVDKVDVNVKGFMLPVDKLADVKVKSTERNWAARCDAWIFPFLNLYLIGGYTWQHTDAGFDVDMHKIIPFGSGHKQLDLNIDFTGPTFGGGMTLVGGYKDYFAVFDTNYTFSDMKGDLFADNTLSQQIDATLFSVRLGWHKKLNGAQFDIWLGETYWDTTNTIIGHPAIPLLGAVDFTVDESTEKPYSSHIGALIEITGHVQFMFDMGTNFSGLFCVAPSLMFRF